VNKRLSIERTTDLDKVRNCPRLFTWGSVEAIIDIGPYTLIEYRPIHGGAIRTTFHVYIDGKSTSNGADTLEEALLIAIARKHLEPNESRYMAMGACKLLGIK
jgi:hypothetical protein